LIWNPTCRSCVITQPWIQKFQWRIRINGNLDSNIPPRASRNRNPKLENCNNISYRILTPSIPLPTAYSILAIREYYSQPRMLINLWQNSTKITMQCLIFSLIIAMSRAVPRMSFSLQFIIRAPWNIFTMPYSNHLIDCKIILKSQDMSNSKIKQWKIMMYCSSILNKSLTPSRFIAYQRTIIQWKKTNPNTLSPSAYPSPKWIRFQTTLKHHTLLHQSTSFSPLAPDLLHQRRSACTSPPLLQSARN